MEKQPEYASRKKSRVFTIDELAEFCKGLTGNRKHDHEHGKAVGLSRTQTDILRAILGKVEYSIKDIDKATKQEIVDEYYAGTPVKDIAAKHGFKYESYVFNIVKQMGKDTDRHEKWSPMKMDNLLYLKDVKKYTWKQVAMAVGKSSDACISKYRDMKRPLWSKSKIAQLLHLRDVENMSWKKIGFAVYKSPDVCKAKYEEITSSGESKDVV